VPAEGNGARAPIFERLRGALRGIDRAEAPALPLGEAVHPVTLAAVVLLLVNDWVLKPHLGHAPAAGLITGKLSDLAGLVFAPVVLSAAVGLVLHAAARLGARVDPSLSRRRLIGCMVATGAVFAAVKLDPAAARALATLISGIPGISGISGIPGISGISGISGLGRSAAIVADRTDLLCLPALGLAWWIGRDELRRVPLGRPAAIHRLGRPAGPALDDVRRAGAPAAHIAVLAAAIDAWEVSAIDNFLVISSK
jgi:hypothetical protein